MPGVTNIWTQPIQNRIDMLSTGIRSQVGLKIFGNDLNSLKNFPRRVAEVVKIVPGAVMSIPSRLAVPLTSTFMSTDRQLPVTASMLAPSGTRSRKASANRTSQSLSKAVGVFRCACATHSSIAAVPRPSARFRLLHHPARPFRWRNWLKFKPWKAQR